MRFSFLLSALLLTLYSYSQDNKGYYITNDNQKVTGFFKTGYFYSPEKLEFKEEGSDAYVPLPADDIKEYGIDNEFKLEKHSVEIDYSNPLSSQKEPEWQRKTVFLNVLVEGDASLYSFDSGNDIKYFYSVKSGNIAPNQLIYKKYRSGGAKLENKAFRQQLFVNMKCNIDKQSDFAGIDYTEQSLTNAIIRYNACVNASQKKYSNRGSQEIAVKYTLVGGMNMNTFKLEGNNSSDKESKMNFNLGAEAAIIMPSGKFGAFARIEYTHVNAEVSGTTKFTNRPSDHTLDASMISLFIGPRYYFGKSGKGLFADAAIGMGLGSGEIEITNDLMEKSTVKVISNIGFSAGLGYNITGKFGLDLRYETNRTLTKETAEYKFGKIGLNLRYTLN